MIRGTRGPAAVPSAFSPAGGGLRLVSRPVDVPAQPGCVEAVHDGGDVRHRGGAERAAGFRVRAAHSRLRDARRFPLPGRPPLGDPVTVAAPAGAYWPLP